MDDCYPLAFGVPAIVMLLSFIMFLCGTPLYVQKPPSGNMLVKVVGCIFVRNGFLLLGLFVTIIASFQNALGQRIKHGKQDYVQHWLDYSTKKYGESLVNDTKVVLNIFVIFIPIPIYWSGLLLQYSRWVFQATKMNGDIGWFVIKPDQMLVFNPALSLLLFPFCEYLLYPLLAKLGMKTLLQRMTFGIFLTAAALASSTIIEIQIEKNFLSILWLIPQFFFIVISENSLYIANLTFAYNEAPSNMKSVMTSLVFVTIAIGNLIIAFITGLKFFSYQFHEFLFFTILVFVDTIIFGFLASRYRSVE